LSEPFVILYENEDLLIVDKPAGWVCSEENCQRTFGPRLKLIHRLDKDTTGALALAKSAKSRDVWMERFAKREMEKHYLAIVDGVPKEAEGTRESYLARKRTFEGQTIWGSASRGLHAVTHWKKLAHGNAASLLLCTPETGRTHQIRVHLAEMGHPILIDRQYAAQFRCPLFSRRPLLHAFRLRFEHILGEAPLPLDMRNFLLSLEIQVGHLRQFFGPNPERNSRGPGHGDEETEKVGERPHVLHELS
jgi:RluA family pseudouridine synthase